MRHGSGGVRKQRGRWIGLWYESGVKRSKVLGLCREMSTREAREAVARIAISKREAPKGTFGSFVKAVYLPFFSRKWKHSTNDKNINRIGVHLVREFESRELGSFRRDGLQDFLDQKSKNLSYSVVNHLRFDLKQIFNMAVAEGVVDRNPALLLFTPKEAQKPVRRVMLATDVKMALSALEAREALIAKLAICAGMRPGEVFALRWGRVGATFVEVMERVYEGVLDTPKTDQSYRKVALTDALQMDIAAWRAAAVDASDDAFIFPSERGTPLSKHNVWRRNMQTKLRSVGLEWCTFQVMRRTHSTLMKSIKADPKLVADQMGHTVDVNQNVYTQSSVALRLPLVNELEKLIQ